MRVILYKCFMCDGHFAMEQCKAVVRKFGNFVLAEYDHTAPTGDVEFTAATKHICMGCMGRFRDLLSTK